MAPSGEGNGTPSSGIQAPGFSGRVVVALSGGGVRAAFFGIGVLLYLVRSGANKSVSQLISVSGGSVPNAALAISGDFSQMSEEEFSRPMSELASKLSRNGTFFIAPKAKLLVLVWTMPIVGIVTILAENVVANLFPNVPGVEAHDGNLGQIALDGLSTAFVGGAVAFLILVVFRARLQRRGFARLLENVASEAPTALSGLPVCNVRHVLCATDLESGQPFYFMRDRIFSSWLGQAPTPESVKLADALYASSAFPVVFPPLKFKTRDVVFTGGASGKQRPQVLRLADGGVYNNLGHDFPELWLSELRMSPPEGFSAPLDTVEPQMLIVNGSSPPKPKTRIFSKYLRTFIVMYENTVQPRLRLLRESTSNGPRPIIVDVDMTPDDAVAESRSMLGDDPAGRKRAEDVDSALKEFASGFWMRIAQQSTSTKTTLSAIGHDRAALLMQHGYYSAMAALHIRFGFRLEPLPERFFQTFAGLPRD